MTPEEALKYIEKWYQPTTEPEEREKAIKALSVIIKSINEIQQYREIGTVEECRKAVEKQKAKKCVEDSCPDHTHYKCPSCGQIELSIYKHGFPRLGRITKYCENCGQALIDNDLEGMQE